jgi:CRP-like cAMP-binding protein
MPPTARPGPARAHAAHWPTAPAAHISALCHDPQAAHRAAATTAALQCGEAGLLVAVRGPGDFLGEMELLGEASRRAPRARSGSQGAREPRPARRPGASGRWTERARTYSMPTGPRARCGSMCLRRPGWRPRPRPAPPRLAGGSVRRSATVRARGDGVQVAVIPQAVARRYLRSNPLVRRSGQPLALGSPFFCEDMLPHAAV